MSWKWRAPYPITPEHKHPVPLSDLKIHLYYMLTTFISECDASPNLFWAFFFFWYFLSRHRFLLSCSQWTVASQNELGSAAVAVGGEAGLTARFMTWQIYKPSFYSSTLGKLFSCVSVAIIVVIINLVVLKVQDLYSESFRSSVTLRLHGMNVTKAKRERTFPAKSPFLSHPSSQNL